MNEKERQKICDKNDAYACLRSYCEYAEAADCQFICNKPSREEEAEEK